MRPSSFVCGVWRSGKGRLLELERTRETINRFFSLSHSHCTKRSHVQHAAQTRRKGGSRQNRTEGKEDGGWGGTACCRRTTHTVARGCVRSCARHSRNLHDGGVVVLKRNAAHKRRRSPEEFSMAQEGIFGAIFSRAIRPPRHVRALQWQPVRRHVFSWLQQLRPPLQP
jgi:hypothetical protein